eukprot:8543586-Pyramimonas_sp.AAC.1
MGVFTKREVPVPEYSKRKSYEEGGPVTLGFADAPADLADAPEEQLPVSLEQTTTKEEEYLRKSFHNRAATAHTRSSTSTPSKARQHSVFAQMWACASYGLVSVSLTITQKTVFHSYSFHYPNSVTLLQILTSLVLLHVLRACGKIDFVGFEWAKAKKVFPLACAWWLYVVSGVTALRYLTLPDNPLRHWMPAAPDGYR